MRFKIDENLPSDVADTLSAAGHGAVTVLDEHMSGQTDAKVIAVILREERALVTLDQDFADIRTYPPAQYPGLIVLRPQRQDKAHVLRLLKMTLPLLDRETLKGRLWIVDENTIRVRGDESSMDNRTVEI